MNRASQVAATIQTIIGDAEFISAHRKSHRAFLRNRKLPFGIVVSTILQLAKRSLQIECNLLGERQMTESASKQAFSKARYNVSYTARPLMIDYFKMPTRTILQGYGKATVSLE